MLTKRVIACLDVRGGRVVKGVQFVDIVDAGDPAELAHRHAAAGADEIVLLDITATHEGRGTLLDTVKRTAAELFVPFTVGGGIRSAEDAAAVFDAGADKVSINSSAIARPELIGEIGGSFGAQIGVTSTDLVLVFTDRKPMNTLEGGKDLKLGVDAGVVAGPIGREAEAGVNAKLQSSIYAYSRSKGLFAGIALDGAILSIDKDANEKVYGASVDAKQILNGTTAMNITVRSFMDALDKVVPKKRLSQR